MLQYTYEHQGTDLLLRYKWIEVVPDFIMPFGVKPIDADEGLRFVATTQEQETDYRNIFQHIRMGLGVSNDGGFAFRPFM